MSTKSEAIELIKKCEKVMRDSPEKEKIELQIKNLKERFNIGNT